MIACGEAQGGSASNFSELMQQVLAATPLAYGGTDVNLITGTDSGSHVTQSETFSWRNPNNTNEIVVTYNDSRGFVANPINISGASVSTDGGTTFTRLTAANGQSPFPNTTGDPVILFNRPTATWFTVWIGHALCGGGLDGFKPPTPRDPSPASWTHFCVNSNSFDDRESGWADNNPASPFFGRMYVSWNDFDTANADIFVRYTTDNGLTWTNVRQVSSGGFFRNVQITGDKVTGDVYIAGMDEGGGGLTTRANKIYRSTDGGNSWTNTYTGP